MSDASAATGRWNTPSFREQARANAAGGLFVVAVVAIVGVVGKVSMSDLLVYAGVPLVVLLLLGLSLRMYRALVAKIGRWETWLADTNMYLTEVAVHLRRLHLQHVIDTAQTLEWKVLDAARNLEFESPEGEDEVYVVRDLTPDPSQVAKDLHNTSPHHFPEEWVAPPADTARVAWLAAVRHEDVSQQIAALDARVDDAMRALADVPRDFMKLRLADVVPQARRAGWADDWRTDAVVFSKEDDQATVSYDDPAGVSVDRVRIVLGLDPLGPDQGDGPGARPH
jgi:hypothetical protein